MTKLLQIFTFIIVARLIG